MFRHFGKINEKGNKIVLIGDPDFDLDMMLEQEAGSDVRVLARRMDEGQGATRRSCDMGNLHFSNLPGITFYGTVQIALSNRNKSVQCESNNDGAASLPGLHPAAFDLFELTSNIPLN